MSDNIEALRVTVMEREKELEDAQTALESAEQAHTEAESAALGTGTPKAVDALAKAGTARTRAKLAASVATRRLESARGELEAAETQARRIRLAELEAVASVAHLHGAIADAVARLVAIEADASAAVSVIVAEVEKQRLACAKADQLASRLGQPTQARYAGIELTMGLVRVAIRNARVRANRQKDIDINPWLAPAPIRIRDDDPTPAGAGLRRAEHLLSKVSAS